MSLRIELVDRVEGGEKLAPVCRELGVSRTTGHKWYKRYKAHGYEGLEEEDRQPKSVPLAAGEEVVMAVLEARLKHSRWGARKLRRVLERKLGEATPSERTIVRILRRADLLRQRRIRRRPSVVDRAPQVQALGPNDVWTVDFKGWWRTRDGKRCDPLTVRDAFSRFVLCVQLCEPTTRDVREIFERLFARYGVPSAIQCDNGSPFVSVRSRAGVSTLSAWWLSLGIKIVRSRPGHPQDNGGHERMHGDIAADVQSSPAATREAQQKVLDRWRQEFNAVRPHDALQGKTPAEVYKPTERRKAVVLPYDYPLNLSVVTVHRAGTFAWRGETYLLGLPFSGMKVGIELVDTLHIRAWLRDVDLGLVEVIPNATNAAYEQLTPTRKQKTMTTTPPVTPPATSRSIATRLEASGAPGSLEGRGRQRN